VSECKCTSMSREPSSMGDCSLTGSMCFTEYQGQQLDTIASSAELQCLVDTQDGSRCCIASLR
jgi:hypothetical protein